MSICPGAILTLSHPCQCRGWKRVKGCLVHVIAQVMNKIRITAGECRRGNEGPVSGSAVCTAPSSSPAEETARYHRRLRLPSTHRENTRPNMS
ncbi:hypothetical protein SDJN03_16385, partial [Cucurbita argyrosperma subsp. sororia]